MLLKKQRNDLLLATQNVGIAPNIFVLEEDDYQFYIELPGHPKYYFRIDSGRAYTFELKMCPGYDAPTFSKSTDSWNDVYSYAGIWASNLADELNAPDLWAEAARAAQLFAPTTSLSDEKFTRSELAEVQSQLRQLQQSFTTAALPEAARQKLIELTQTAAVKAEGLNKKDWQNWIIGGFISAITSLMLNPTQAAEVLKLVKAAFGGLFLH
jgi:hypothetical protein